MSGKEDGRAPERTITDRQKRPHLLQRWLRWIAPPEFEESIFGDLMEERSRRDMRHSRTWSVLLWWLWQVLAVSAGLILARLRPSAVEPRRVTERRRMEALLLDVRFALRSLRRAPGFTVVAVATLAIGIGATTAMFGVLEALLLRALPYPAAGEIVMIWPVRADRGPGQLSAANAELFDVRARGRIFEYVAGIDYRNATLGGADNPERVRAAAVSADIFPLLGVEPARGRVFSAQEDLPGADAVVVLGHGLWERRFGADPELVGQTIRLGEKRHIVVGIMPPGFLLPPDYGAALPSELWLPLGLNPVDPGFRGSKELDRIVARLADGVSTARAQQDLDELVASLWEQHPDQYAERRWSLLAAPPLDHLLGPVRPTLALLTGAVVLVMVIACTNGAHLLTGRGEDRRVELAMRQALGAGRGRVVRQLLTESAVLAGLAAVVGAALTHYAIVALRVGLPAGFPRASEIAINGSVLAFVTALAAATALAFGLAPALRMVGSATYPTLGRENRIARPGGGRLLVIVQVALAVVLTVGSGLLLRTLRAYTRVDPGFTPDGVISFGLSLPSSRYPEAVQVQGFYRDLLDRIESLPGVTGAGAVRRRPLAEPMGTWAISLYEDAGDPRRPSTFPDWQVVTHGAFEALGIRLSEGRLFDATDEAGAPGVAVINRSMATAYWPDEPALGKRFRLDGGKDNPWITVVGIVEDVRHTALDAEVAPKMYLPHAHYAAASSVSAVPAMWVVVRASPTGSALVGALRRTVWDLDAELPLLDVRPMDEIVEKSFSRPRTVAGILSLLAAIALTLAASGVYGVTTAHVLRRRREIGVRMALGADATTVRKMVLRDGLGLTTWGLALGLVGSAVLSRWLARFLYGVGSNDPATLAAVVLVLAAVALSASYLPASRASRVAPLASIRSE